MPGASWNTGINNNLIKRVDTMNIIRVFTVLSLFYVFSCSDTATGPEENFPDAIDFSLTDIDGNLFTLSDFYDGVIVLNFFASWCGPCQEEMPKLEKNIWKIYENQNVMVIGIDLIEDLGVVKLYAVNNMLTFRIVIDMSGDIFASYAGGSTVTNVPYNVIIDTNQKIRYSETGYNENVMITLIEELLNND